jgi:2,4-dienoyl-CoA reductase-like NADH-dependent reductase (Old Yellow Enzyme family)/thioredoxin reductase
MKNYPHLFSPLKLGNLVLKNRIEAAPTGTRLLTAEGYLTPEEISYYEMKAAGGAAIVTLGQSFVHTRTGVRRWPEPPLDDPGILPSLAMAARAIKRHGAIPSIELQHQGKSGGWDRFKQQRVRYGPCAGMFEDGTEVFEMSEDLILEIIESFGQAAADVKRVGFEMLMVHGGHGWLISQFLSPLENKRTDKFGGSFENRARLPLMIIERIRQAVGHGFPIEFRMSGDDFVEGGFSLQDGIKFAKLIENKVELIHVSAGSHEVKELYIRTHPSVFLKRGCNVYLATAIKQQVKTPVACVGGITEIEMMEDIIATGKADVVAVARALLADPYLPKKAAAGRTQEITPCVRCSNCLAMGNILEGGAWICTSNPRMGNEFESKYILPPREEPKTVLIAGGGPAGMQAAITASSLGHKVTLCEKSASLGGAIKFAKSVPFKEDLYKFEQHLEYMLKSSGAVVMLNTEVTPEFVAFQDPDVLIVAAGATPIVPDIPGIHHKNVVIANDLHNTNTRIGDKVVILGGGMVGCEEGIYLGMMGKDVTIVEMLDDVARDANRLHKLALILELAKYAKVVTGFRGKKITEEGLLCEGANGKEVLFKADTVVCAVGNTALTSVVEHLRDTAPEFYYIGDCANPQTVMEAIRTGYNTAMAI